MYVFKKYEKNEYRIEVSIVLLLLVILFWLSLKKVCKIESLQILILIIIIIISKSGIIKKKVIFV